MTGTGRSRGSVGPLLRLTVTATLLVLLVRSIPAREVAAHLSTVRVEWLMMAAAISLLQVAGSAWRWRYTAARLGLELPFRHALREYYLATFLNQVLPGGIVGDVSRAWRHARMESDAGGRSVRAVLLERTSGQAVMLGAAALSLAVLPLDLPSFGAGPWLAGLVCGGGLLGIVAHLAPGGSGWKPAPRSVGRAGVLARFLEGMRKDIRRALFAGEAPAVQLGTSLLVVGSYVALYVVAGYAVGTETPLDLLVPLVPPVLLAMLLPVSFAGWGVREGAAAVLWAAVGLPAAEGVAISLAYGVLVLVTSLPGAWILLSGPADRGRRGRRSRDGSDDREDGAPRRERPPAPA